jgi:hypothetical protein
MSGIVVDFGSRHTDRLRTFSRAGEARDRRIQQLIADCVASLHRNPPDRLHSAIRSALHDLLECERGPRQSIGRERSAS